MGASMIIRGVACPFGEGARLREGRLEVVARGAFVLEPHRTDVVFGAHDGPSILSAQPGALRLWQNDLGLCFELATVDLASNGLAARVISPLKSEALGCSVEFDMPRYQRSEDRGVVLVWSAAINHIALLRDPAYAGTAAWLADDEDAGRLSPRLSRLARLSAAGRPCVHVPEPIVAPEPAARHVELGGGDGAARPIGPATLGQLAARLGEGLWAIAQERLSLAVRAPTQRSPSRGVAVIPLQGALTQRGLALSGRVVAEGLSAFAARVSAAAANPDVSVIVLDVDSPGGTFAGTPEAAAAVARAAGRKRVVAMVDTLCASAAYMIASQATEIVVTPSGELGSIGVLAVHAEQSKMLDEIGIKVTVVRSRASKADVNPYEPLTQDARASLQRRVMEADSEFLATVAKGRKLTVAQVRCLVDENGLGRTVGAKQAVALGLADRVAPMADVLATANRVATTWRREALFS